MNYPARTRPKSKKSYPSRILDDMILSISTPPRPPSSPFHFQPSSYPHQSFSFRPISSPCSFPFAVTRPALSRRNKAKPQLQELNEPQPEPEEEVKVLTAVQSNYNSIVILDTADSRVLLLDSTHNIHSIATKGDRIWTQSYWDEFVTLPAIVPKGESPIAIFGLGGGTAAKLMLQIWPSLKLHGWEIDEILIHKARDFLGLADLEKATESGGILEVIVGDALCASSTFAGGYAGIVVDLFNDGRVLPELEEAKTWIEMKEKLMPGGRIMVNCGGASVDDRNSDQDLAGWEQNYAIRAMKKAFPAGELHWKRIPNDMGANFLALTGALPDLSTWADAIPPNHCEYLRPSVHSWRTC